MGETVHSRPARVIALTGTTVGPMPARLAVALGGAFVRNGARVALVETDLERARLAPLLGRPASPSMADVLAGRCSLAETLVAGPGGLHATVGSRGGSNRLDSAAQRRLLDEVDALAGGWDVVLLVPAVDRSAGTRLAIGAAHAVVAIVPAECPPRQSTLAALRALAGPAEHALGLVLEGAAAADDARAAYAALVRATRFGALARLAHLASLSPAADGGGLQAAAELVARWADARAVRPRGELQFCFEPLLAAGEAA